MDRSEFVNSVHLLVPNIKTGCDLSVKRSISQDAIEAVRVLVNSSSTIETAPFKQVAQRLADLLSNGWAVSDNSQAAELIALACDRLLQFSTLYGENKPIPDTDVISLLDAFLVGCADTAESSDQKCIDSPQSSGADQLSDLFEDDPDFIEGYDSLNARTKKRLDGDSFTADPFADDPAPELLLDCTKGKGKPLPFDVFSGDPEVNLE